MDTCAYLEIYTHIYYIYIRVTCIYCGFGQINRFIFSVAGCPNLFCFFLCANPSNFITQDRNYVFDDVSRQAIVRIVLRRNAESQAFFSTQKRNIKLYIFTYICILVYVYCIIHTHTYIHTHI